jgi:hypothetical protein
VTKQKLDIEKLLQWTYRDELPKLDLSAGDGEVWNSVEAYLDRGGTASDPDPWEAHLRSQRYAFVGQPHDDAIRLDCMVRRLEDVTVRWPSSRGILLGHLSIYERPADALIMQRMKAQTSHLVMAHARMRTRPIWNVDQRLGPVKLKNGKPLVRFVDRHGRFADCNYGQRDYLRGGQCPVRLDPTCAEIASARFEYFVWHSALVDLVRMANASWKLDDHEALPPAAAQAPWLTGPERTSRVLTTILPGKAQLTTPTVPA